MTRVKRGTLNRKRRSKVLALTKGFRWDRKSKERAAKEALLHGMRRMMKGRKEKKRVARGNWNIRINAAAREKGVKYSVLINLLKKKNIKLDRKILADLALNAPKVFEVIIETAKKN